MLGDIQAARDYAALLEGLDVEQLSPYHALERELALFATRRQIFDALKSGPHSVGELAARVPVSRPAVSQHLKVLKDARLVFDRPAGTRRIYQVDPDGLAALRGYLDHFWDQALAGFKAAVEQQTKESP